MKPACLILICFLILLNACGDKGGADIIYTLAGISITNSRTDTSSVLNGSDFDLSFLISDSTISEKGTRKSRHKDLNIEYSNHWQSEGFKLMCNKVLVINKDTIQAFSNLVIPAATKDQIGLLPWGMISLDENQLRFSGISTLSPKQTHLFFIQGITTDNLTYTDTCKIFIK